MAPFGKVKDKEQRAKLVELLAFIVAGTQGQFGYALVPEALANQILKYEPTFVKFKNDTPDPAGSLQVFATSLGVAAVRPSGEKQTITSADVATVNASDLVKPVFDVAYDIPLPPPSTRGGGFKTSIYPFDTMNVNGTFFVAATEAKPNPAKSMISTISAANRRYLAAYPPKHAKAGQPTGKDGRKFVVRPRNLAEHKEVGARVWRIK